MTEYLTTHLCVDCGEADTRVLEFDHIRGSEYRDVSTLVGEGFGLGEDSLRNREV